VSYGRLGVNCRQDVLRQFSIVSMELFNTVEDIKNVSKVFVVYPRNDNAENATSMFMCFLLFFKDLEGPEPLQLIY